MPADQTIIAHAPAAALALDPVSGPAVSPISVAPGKQAVLGRSSQSTVVLPDESVSRRHACIRPAGGTWFIEDLSSRHGTYVNAVPILPNQTAPLKRGDLVGIGPWSFRVRIGTAAPGAEPHITTTIDQPQSKAERVERVAERELAQLTRIRLGLLIDVAGAVAGAGDEAALAKIICEAAARGTGFPRAAILRDTGLSNEVRVVCESGPGGVRVGVAASPPARPSTSDLAPASQAAGTPIPPPPAQTPAAVHSFSRSLIAEARKGEVARLTSDQPMSTTESIMRLGIQTALCAPIVLAAANTGAPSGSGQGPAAVTVVGFLYLDARTGEGGPGSLSSLAERRPSAVATVQNDAAAFCLALAKMYALAFANLSRAELEARQRELERDLQAAHEAQQSIMPPEEGRHGRLRYAMRCKSGRYVAGDLFGVVEIADGRTAVFLGDVAGKGVGAAIFMATAQTHLSVALSADPDPARAVNAVNRRLSSLGMGSRFISLWLGVIDSTTGLVSFVDAGHGYCLITPAGGGQPARRVRSVGGLPLGVDPDSVYQAETLTLAPGERLVLFSDGVVEQPGCQSEEDQFGLDRAAEALAPATDCTRDVAALFEAVLAHAGTDDLADDTTVASVMIELVG